MADMETRGMIERVAAAMYTRADKRTGTHLPWEEWAPTEPDGANNFRDLARAAIEAMREPTKDMLAAGADGVPDKPTPWSGFDTEEEHAADIWRRMQAAALPIPPDGG